MANRRKLPRFAESFSAYDSPFRPIYADIAAARAIEFKARNFFEITR